MSTSYGDAPRAPAVPVESTGNGLQRIATRPAEAETLIPDLLDIVLERGASDLHLTAGSPPGPAAGCATTKVLSFSAVMTRLYVVPVRNRGGLVQGRCAGWNPGRSSSSRCSSTSASC